MEKINCKICQKFDAFPDFSMCLDCVRSLADEFELNNNDMHEIMTKRLSYEENKSYKNFDLKVCKKCEDSFCRKEIENTDEFSSNICKNCISRGQKFLSKYN